VLEVYYNLFRDKDYAYLNGYTSSLVAFADFIIRTGRDPLKSICPTLKVCIATSEICTAEDRKVLEDGFGVKVINEYGAAELDILAIEDEKGNWVLNEENLYIEVVNEDDEPVEDGEEGRILVTSLYNKAMPFIRYELGDLGAISDKRIGPYRTLEKLTGRTNDMAILPSGRKVPGLTFYYVTKSLLREEGIIREIIVRQESPDSFLVRYSGTRDLTEKEKKEVKELLFKYMEAGLRLRIERVNHIKRQPSGKLKQFEKVF
jgi:phenylacetate-CoA ligase